MLEVAIDAEDVLLIKVLVKLGATIHKTSIKNFNAVVYVLSVGLKHIALELINLGAFLTKEEKIRYGLV